jgi:hypothetical protein
MWPRPRIPSHSHSANFFVPAPDRDGNAAPWHTASAASVGFGVTESAQNVNIQSIYT